MRLCLLGKNTMRRFWRTATARRAKVTFKKEGKESKTTSILTAEKNFFWGKKVRRKANLISFFLPHFSSPPRFFLLTSLNSIRLVAAVVVLKWIYSEIPGVRTVLSLEYLAGITIFTPGLFRSSPSAAFSWGNGALTKQMSPRLAH